MLKRAFYGMAERLRSCKTLTAGLGLLNQNAMSERPASDDLQARIAVACLSIVERCHA